MERSKSSVLAQSCGLGDGLTRSRPQRFYVVVHKVAAVAIGTDAHRVEAIAHLSLVLKKVSEIAQQRVFLLLDGVRHFEAL